MNYAITLRESSEKYTETKIQDKLQIIYKLSELSFSKVALDDKYKSLDEDALVALKELIKDKKGKNSKLSEA